MKDSSDSLVDESVIPVQPRLLAGDGTSGIRWNLQKLYLAPFDCASLPPCMASPWTSRSITRGLSEVKDAAAAGGRAVEERPPPVVDIRLNR
jgi:hypothetical protein